MLLGHRQGREKDGVASPQLCLLLPTVPKSQDAPWGFPGILVSHSSSRYSSVMPSQPGAHHLLQQLHWPAGAGSGICVAGTSAWEGAVQGQAEAAEFTSMVGVIPLNAFIKGRRKPALSWPAEGCLSALLPSVTLPPWVQHASAAQDIIKEKQLISRRVSIHPNTPSIPLLAP